MKKMTVLALHLGYGGVEKAISDLVDMLHDSYEIEIISTYKLYEVPSFPIPSDVKITYLLPEYQPNKKEIKEAIRKKQPLRLLTEGFRSMKILYLRRKTMIEAIKNCKSDIIVSTRVMYTEWLSAFGNSQTIKISQEHNHHNGDQKYIRRIVKSCKNIDYFMPVSQELTEFYKRQIQNGKTKVVYIPHCLDYFPSQVSDYQDEAVVSIGRLSPEKGFLDLLDVFSLVHEKQPNVILHLIGDGSQYDDVMKKIQLLHLENNVRMHGFLKQDSIHQILEHAKVYVMTSFQESFGLVLLEAQSFALPCIAFSSAQGAHEIIKNENNGFFIEARDKKKMAEKICELLDHEELLKKLGQEGRKNAQAYTKGKIKEVWLNFLAAL